MKNKVAVPLKDDKMNCLLRSVNNFCYVRLLPLLILLELNYTSFVYSRSLKRLYLNAQSVKRRNVQISREHEKR